MQLTNGSPQASTGAGCTKNTFGSFASNISGPPPAGSDERVVVALRDVRGGNAQQRRERAEHEVDVVLRDQVLVVRDDLVRAARVVDDLQLDLPAEDAAVRVHRVGPQLVPPLRGLARIGEVAGQRERDPDHERFGGGAPAHVTRGARAAAARARRQEPRCQDRHQQPASPVSHGPFLPPRRPPCAIPRAPHAIVWCNRLQRWEHRREGRSGCQSDVGGGGGTPNHELRREHHRPALRGGLVDQGEQQLRRSPIPSSYSSIRTLVSGGRSRSMNAMSLNFEPATDRSTGHDNPSAPAASRTPSATRSFAATLRADGRADAFRTSGAASRPASIVNPRASAVGPGSSSQARRASRNPSALRAPEEVVVGPPTCPIRRCPCA